MRRAALGATLAIAASLGLITASPSSAAVPRSFYGIVTFAQLGNSDFARMGGARVGTVRFQVLWPFMQQTRNGPIDFSSTDAIVRGAAQQHISLLPDLFTQAGFDTKSCGNDQGCQRHIYLGTATQRHDWQVFVATIVQRYGPNGSFWRQNPGVPYDPVRRWQVWNEQNAPTQKNSAKLYAKLLKLTDSAVSGVDPKAKLVLGGMFGTPKGSKKFTAWRYLSGLYKNHAKRHFDVATLHPYSPDIPGTLDDQIKKIRRVLKGHHDAKTPLLIGEIGWGSSTKKHGGTGSLGAQFNVTPKKQAKNLKESFKLLTSHRKRWKINGVDWFTWKDPANPPAGLCAFCYSSGLYKANGTTAKPALHAYKSFTRRTGH